MKEYKVLKPKPGSHKYDLIGQKFGKLIVKSLSGLDKHKNKLWLCDCDCGNTCEIKTTQLTSGKRTSCSCNRYKKGENVYNFTGYKEITGAKWYSFKSNAKVRNLDFTISKEYVWDLLKKQNDKCYFSGLAISFSDKTASIDRLDSTFGYTTENIVLVHKDINRMKTDFSVNYFIELCKSVNENYKKINY